MLSEIPIRVLNLSPDGVTIYKGTRIAEASLLPENDVLLISEVHNSSSTDCPVDVPLNKRQLLWQAVESTAKDLTDGQ